MTYVEKFDSQPPKPSPEPTSIEILALAGVRKVKTQGGSRYYGKPIGSLIGGDKDTWQTKFASYVNKQIPGVTMQLKKDSATGNVHLAKLNVADNLQGKGVAQDILTDLTNEADKFGNTLTIDPSVYKDTKSRLISWAKNHGFAKGKDAEKDEPMHRAPKGKKGSDGKTGVGASLTDTQKKKGDVVWDGKKYIVRK